MTSSILMDNIVFSSLFCRIGQRQGTPLPAWLYNTRNCRRIFNLFTNCRFERTICKSYNNVSNFIVLIHKYRPTVFVHPARQQKTAASSPSPSLLRKSTSPKGRGLGKEMKFVWIAKGSHFEGRLPPAGGRCRAATKRGIWRVSA